MNKKFYFIDELNSKFDISIADIKYLNLDNKIQCRLYCKESDLIVGGYIEKKFVGIGTAKYKGLIYLNSNQLTKILEQETIKIHGGSVLQLEYLSTYSQNYPFTVTTPNPVITKWQPQSIPEKWNSTNFIFLPKQGKSAKKQFIQSLADIAFNCAESSNKHDIKALDVQDELFYTKKEFGLSDLCIELDEIEKLRSLLGKKTKPKEANRDIDKLLINVIKAFPQYKPAQLWDELKADLIREPRLYDENEIIDEVGDKELYYSGPLGEEVKLNKKSFYNLLKKLK